MTLNKKHTPGPWALESAMSSDTPHIRYITADTKIIASVRHRTEHSQEMALANARLIAAAPILLDALQAIVDEAGPQFGHDEEPGCINRMARLARLAIAKATGGADA